jgi:cell division protein FtsW (lipid II flippase)
MIDPWSIIPHALWLLGLAILLATFSYRDWSGSHPRHAAPPVAADRSRMWYLVGLLFFCLGMLATSGSTLERAGWAIVLLLVLAQLLLPSLRLARRREPTKPPATQAYEPPQ